MDNDKILTALKFCSAPSTSCSKKCPYYHKHNDDTGCIQILTADAAKLVEELTLDVKALNIIRDLLKQDIEDRDKMLEAKVEEVYPEFMADYRAMKEELDGLYEELEETKLELYRERRGY